MSEYILPIENDILSCPTAIHLDYLQYMIHFCKSNKINLLLKGSVSTGEATRFSDIDIVIIEDRMDIIEKMVSGYQRIIMSNMTERPKGILIIIYENGLCIDLDVRNSITQEELTKLIILNCENVNNFVSADLVRNKEVKVSSVMAR